MTTRNFVPRAAGEGSLGTEAKPWGNVYTKKLVTPDGDINKNIDVRSSIITATSPAFYERASLPKPAQTKITIAPTWINVNGAGCVSAADCVLDLNSATAWDNGTYATAASRAGKDFYIYAAKPQSGNVPAFVLSANATCPTGYTAGNVRQIGGFHCLCKSVGTISGHALSGYVTGDILPASVWDLKWRAIASNAGMVWCGTAWVDIYLAGWDGSKLVSQYGATIQDGYSPVPWHGEKFVEYFHKLGKRLIWRDEFVDFAKGSNEKTNIAGSADPGTTGGHVDTAGRRMISNYGVEDCVGVQWQWCGDISMVPAKAGASNLVANDTNYYLENYTWDPGNRVGNAEVDGDKTKYGNTWGVGPVRLLVGAYWADGSSCGSRSVYGDLLSARRSDDRAGRGASELRSAAR